MVSLTSEQIAHISATGVPSSSMSLLDPEHDLDPIVEYIGESSSPAFTEELLAARRIHLDLRPVFPSPTD